MPFSLQRLSQWLIWAHIPFSSPRLRMLKHSMILLRQPMLTITKTSSLHLGVRRRKAGYVQYAATYTKAKNSRLTLSVLSANIPLLISNLLSDNCFRLPAFFTSTGIDWFDCYRSDGICLESNEIKVNEVIAAALPVTVEYMSREERRQILLE